MKILKILLNIQCLEIKIAFSFGEVHFNGTLLEDGQKLELSYHSGTNGIEDTKIFKFISLDVLADIQDLDLIHN